MIRGATIATIAWLAGVGGAAQAQEEPTEPRPLVTYERIYVRAGVLHVAMLSESDELVLSEVSGPASLAVSDGPIEGSGVELDSITIPALILGYVLPVADDRLALETVLGLPFRVTFRATGTLADQSLAPSALGIPTGVGPLGSTLGEAEAAPPIATAIYRVADAGPVSLFLGTGVSVLVTYDARATNPILTAAGEPTFEVDPAPGWVLQAAIDVALWWHLRLRVDVKYIAFMRAQATVTNLAVQTPELPLFESANVGTATMDLWVNPLILTAGIGVGF